MAELGASDVVVDVAIDGGRERRPFPLAAMVVPHAFELLGDDGTPRAWKKRLVRERVARLYG